MVFGREISKTHFKKWIDEQFKNIYNVQKWGIVKHTQWLLTIFIYLYQIISNYLYSIKNNLIKEYSIHHKVAYFWCIK